MLHTYTYSWRILINTLPARQQQADWSLRNNCMTRQKQKEISSFESKYRNKWLYFVNTLKPLWQKMFLKGQTIFVQNQMPRIRQCSQILSDQYAIKHLNVENKRITWNRYFKHSLRGFYVFSTFLKVMIHQLVRFPIGSLVTDKDNRGNLNWRRTCLSELKNYYYVSRGRKLRLKDSV